MFHQALTSSQKTLDSYYDRLRKSQIEVARLKAALTTIAALSRKPKNRSKKKDENDDLIREVLPIDVDKLATMIHEAAKMSAQLYVLFWTYFTTDMLMGHKKPKVAWDDVQVRFATRESQKSALIAELFECVPPVFHDYLTLKKKPFSQLVSEPLWPSCNEGLLTLRLLFFLPSSFTMRVKHDQTQYPEHDLWQLSCSKTSALSLTPNALILWRKGNGQGKWRTSKSTSSTRSFSSGPLTGPWSPHSSTCSASTQARKNSSAGARSCIRNTVMTYHLGYSRTTH